MKRRTSTTLEARPVLRDLAGGAFRPQDRQEPAKVLPQHEMPMEASMCPKSTQSDADRIHRIIPSYVSLSHSLPKLPRTRKTLRVRSLQMDLFLAQSVGYQQAEDYVAAGVLRRACVPENYTLGHLSALVSCLMGWPLGTRFSTSVIPPDYDEEGRIIQDAEVWLGIISPDSSEDMAATLPPPGLSAVNKRRTQTERIKLHDVWPATAPVSVDEPNRHYPGIMLDEQIHVQSRIRMQVRIQCRCDHWQSLWSPTDEPLEISGIGAPPASYLPIVRDACKPLVEKYSTKLFQASDFKHIYWEFCSCQVVTEIDVQGIWVWKRSSPELKARLQVLERRASGDWISDLEAEVIV